MAPSLESKGHLQQLKNAPGEVATLKGTAVCSGLVQVGTCELCWVMSLSVAPAFSKQRNSVGSVHVSNADLIEEVINARTHFVFLNLTSKKETKCPNYLWKKTPC